MRSGSGESVFLFTGGDPVNRVDPDGRKVVVVPGASEQFKNRYAATVRYMNSKGTSGGLARLEKSPETYYIGDGSVEGARTALNVKTNTIYWDPSQVLTLENGVVLFPATILAHEIGHANQKDEMTREEFDTARAFDKNNPYDSKLEQDIIEGVEQDAALKHGDIGPGEITRTGHSGGTTITFKRLPDDKIMEDFDKAKVRTAIFESIFKNK